MSDTPSHPLKKRQREERSPEANTDGTNAQISGDGGSSTKRVKITPDVPTDVTNAEQNASPVTEDPNVELHETFAGTLKSFLEAVVAGDFKLTPWVDNLMNTVKEKEELVAKKKEFTTEEKNTIRSIFNVIWKRDEAEKEDPVEARTPGVIAAVWNEAKTNASEENPLIPTFLKRCLQRKRLAENGTVLTCAAALLLDLSCTIDDCCFCEYVRKNCKKEVATPFGSCLITEDEAELRQLSCFGDYVFDESREIIDIKNWARGEWERSTHTLSIGGESGSGKTRAALQCANFYRGKHTELKQDDVLTVYIKVSAEGTKHWNEHVEEKDEETKKGAKIMRVMYEQNDAECKSRHVTYQSTAFLEECIKNSATDGVALRKLRAAQCHDWVCSVINQIVRCPSGMKSKNKFKAAFIVLDEIGSCPWIYKAVNGVSTDREYISKCFRGDTSFAEEVRFVCATTASESLFRDMCSTPGTFYAITMKPWLNLYEKLLLNLIEINNFSAVLKHLQKNIFFDKLVQNRRCCVLAVKNIRTLMSTVNPASSTAAAMNARFKALKGENKEEMSEVKRRQTLFNPLDEESAYAVAGFPVGVVAAEFKTLNGTAGLNAAEAQTIVAKGIRAFLCCEGKELENVFSGFPKNPLEHGLLDCRTEPQKDGTRRVTISVSASQQVMAATAYSGGAIFTCSVSSGAFETFSTSLLSTYLSGYSNSKTQI
ncbi:hypothetical protein AGDE_14854 [Angomonas deanei]|uniref:Uncharacterized protein n=1 Tax=Angomonas deanei TaxID=59799 RepID=A0A7G2C3A9_9TRYP|nr:hypothetical protein AGDE_14854 [Angomonas deanei]CAD2214079.1 hypothetical protein, conserved [Angomonas deanei]|eukprot:EPY20107.1 hypothetical protein AGDE_14854 [Angomonas deanei]